MICKGVDAGHNGPERCVGLVGLREAIDPRWLFVSRSDLVVKTASDTH